MRSTKSIIIFASCGFILSFVFGLFSHSSFLSILLKALIIAVCFAVLGFLIDIIFKKFLKDDSAGDSADYSSESSSDSVKTGQVVDITIEDEELERSESQNHFVIGENRQMLNDSDIGKVNDVKESENNVDTGFIPLINRENVKNVSGTEAVKPGEVEIKSEYKAGDSVNEGSLDTLPDMDSFAFSWSEDDDSSNDDGVAGVIGKSDFPSNSSSRAEPEVKDAALMAKAISSILSDENS